MGKEVQGVPEDPTLGSVGRYLAGQRLLRGISLDDLAVLTKIPRRSLERLEAGAFDHVADGFSRGFVRAVADALGLDPWRHNLAVDVLLADASGYELRILRPKVDDDDPLGRRHLNCRASSSGALP